jgi:hypothetical protein
MEILIFTLLLMVAAACLVSGAACFRACLDMGDNRAVDWAETMAMLAAGVVALVAAVRFVG